MNKVQKLFEQIAKTNKIAIAVSGGSDSMAMVHLAKQYMDPSQLECILVNHNVQQNSQIAIDVATEYLQQQDLKYKVLNVYPTQKTEDKLRHLRYNAIEKYLYEKDIECLLTAHHMDDNIETNMIRLWKSSGIAGLRGISFKSKAPILKKVDIYRPLLQCTKQELLQVCKQNNIPFTEDLSNTDTIYQRNAIRTFLSKIESGEVAFNGSDAFKKNELEKALKMYQLLADEENTKVDQVLSEFFVIDSQFDLGLLQYDKSSEWAKDPYLSNAVLVKILKLVNPNTSPPRASSIAKLKSALNSGIPVAYCGPGVLFIAPNAATGKNNLVIVPAPLIKTLRVKSIIDLSSKPPDNALCIQESPTYIADYKVIFNHLDVIHYRELRSKSSSIFKEFKGLVITHRPEVSKYINVLQQSDFNLKVVFGNETFIGTLSSGLRLLNQFKHAHKASKNELYQLQLQMDQLDHFMSQVPKNVRSIATLIVHVDSQGKEYPVAFPLLNINLIPFHSHFSIEKLNKSK